jgi:hypothetical protein
MIKIYREFLVASLTVIVFVFGMTTNVLALSIPYHILGNNLHKISTEDINSIIDENFNTSYPDISEKSWPPNPTEVLQDEIMEYIFDVSKISWFLTKESKAWYLYYVGNIEFFHWTSKSGKALSSYASVPDASIMLLLGSSLLFLGLLGRRKSKK